MEGQVIRWQEKTIFLVANDIKIGRHWYHRLSAVNSSYMTWLKHHRKYLYIGHSFVCPEIPIDQINFMPPRTHTNASGLNHNRAIRAQNLHTEKKL